ncbi:serine/threonine-protein kinase [Actinoallomurus soli]|uniref:serine/threonine-protein kinase n=1 Tax=Actinoallomurus soli TaxID=2952535 RepID=UPI002092BE59|nr:serine/threonine-protein kinase [Actinoallomurus soli]MCO5972145.1 serine/threonine protein kinase [Actinoallomurus soli]
METFSAPGLGEPTVLASGVLPLEVDDPPAIGGHRLVARLGSGGMGVVYLGRDRNGRLVAVKTARPEDADDETLRLRFQSEADCARRVPGGWTARVLADGTAERPPYLITEYVEGPSLAHIIDTGGPLQPEQLRALATGVARALAAIHGAGMVHRDLKPANVLLTPTGPRIIDFGIAQRLPASGGLTKDGVVMGSPGWIPPERLTGQPATAASDVFGWGCLVAYAGMGHNPFGEGDGDELAGRVIHQPPDLTGLDESLRPLVEAALAKDPAERPRPAELLARLGVGVTAPQKTSPARRSVVPALVAAAIAATAAAVVVTVLYGTHTDKSRPPTGATVESTRPGTPSLRPRGHVPPHPNSAETAPPTTHRTAPGRASARTSPAAATSTKAASGNGGVSNGNDAGGSSGANGSTNGSTNGNGNGSANGSGSGSGNGNGKASGKGQGNGGGSGRGR